MFFLSGFAYYVHVHYYSKPNNARKLVCIKQKLNLSQECSSQCGSTVSVNFSRCGQDKMPFYVVGYLGQLFFDGLDVLLKEVGSDESHAAVDVEPDSPRGHNGLRVPHIQGSHIPYGEPIPRVDIRQTY